MQQTGFESGKSNGYLFLRAIGTVLTYVLSSLAHMHDFCCARDGSIRHHTEPHTLQRTKNIVRMPRVPQKLSFCNNSPSSVQLLKAHLIDVGSEELRKLGHAIICPCPCIDIVTSMKDVHAQIKMSPPSKAATIASW